MADKELPIGYWVKKLDNLLTAGINEIQGHFGMTRSDWQILSTVSDNESMKKKDLIDLMQPFLDSKAVCEVIEKLKIEKLVELNEQNITLSEKGNRQHTNSLKLQNEFRQKLMTGVSEEDYQFTVATLKKIVANGKAPKQ